MHILGLLVQKSPVHTQQRTFLSPFLASKYKTRSQ